MTNPKKILIIAGEASGDLHAAKLINDVSKVNSNIQFYGMGSTKMQEAGAKILINSDKLAVVGVLDVILHFPKIYQAFKKIRNFLLTEKPDLLVLVDYPGFNLKLAKIAKKVKIKVLYYISPQLWASRKYRIHTIKKHVAKMAVIFPFEVDFYQRYNFPVTFVGNPLIDQVKPILPPGKASQKFGLNLDLPIIGLFPGSRKGEIKKLLPIMLESTKILKAKIPNVQFVLALASSLSESDLTPFLQKNNLCIKIVSGYNYDLMNLCSAIIVASGTATLEAALIHVPMVIIYKIFPSFIPITIFTSIPYIGLCNIVAGKKIVPELLQIHANPNEISNEILKILANSTYRINMKFELEKVHAKLLDSRQQSLADLLLEMIS